MVFLKEPIYFTCVQRTYKSLLIVAKTLESILMFGYQAHGHMLQMLSMNFLTHFLILCVPC